MKLVQLDIERLEPSSSNKSTYVLLLREIGGDRKLPIVIGPCNAGSIAIYLESNSNPERPLTHDVIKSITNNFNITISRVVIHTLTEGVFHASFFCFMDGDEEIEIDARTSDAIAIAIRMGCSIFTYNDILQEAGIILTDNLPNYKDEDTEELEETKDILSTLSLGQLKKQMKEAINDENYEKASELRDEINKRKEK
ncbi:MAG: bifunctional nuclease family protein [Flavobacteriales bacterium]|nr:bifunctional nuclease family protein [Flavobacteriales bacterium]MBT7725851.1 bifunctional nuclease family protein [Flavobacteriales bacterium]